MQWCVNPVCCKGAMRTTITLDPDVVSHVRRIMNERGLSFKEAVNEAIRAGAGPSSTRSQFRTRTFDMGEPAIPLDKALRLAGDLEDDELLRKHALRRWAAGPTGDHRPGIEPGYTPRRSAARLAA